MSASRTRTKGANAIIHRAHRKAFGPRTCQPLPNLKPQWTTGARFGQQVAIVRSTGTT